MKWAAMIFPIFLIISCAPHDYPYRIYSHPNENIKIAKIAVMPFLGSTRETGDLASDLISQNLVRKGIRVIDRSNLIHILREQGLSMSGLVEEPDYIKIGKLIDSDFILVGMVKKGIIPESRKTTEAITDVSIKILDVKTGEIVKGATYSLEVDSRGNLESSHSKPLAVLCENLVDYILGAPMPKLIDHKDPESKSH